MILAQCIHDITMSYGLEISLLLAGLVGGVTHCAGMCSPFVLAQVESAPQMGRLSSSLLAPYHLGRMTTYVLMAVLLSTIVNIAFVYSNLKTFIAAPMLVLAGSIFLISAFPRLSALFPWLSDIRITMPYKYIERITSRLLKNPSALGRYGLGILLGFMPCGLVVSALLASATSETVWGAAFAMMLFTLGTIPALFLVALGGQAVKQKYPGAAKTLSQGAMAISGLWLFALAGLMIF